MFSPPPSGAVIFAKDINRLAKFYQQLLSLSVVQTASDHVILEPTNSPLVIHAIPTQVARSINISVPPVVREQTPIKLFFSVVSLAEARASASLLGGQIERDGKEWETRSFRACDGHDPKGNVFQVREKVP